MTTQLVTINQVQIEQLTYRGESVVTLAQIARVHAVSEKTVESSFQRHRDRFTEGKHFYRIDFTEASSLLLSEGANSNGLTVFTRKGYLLLTKPMRDTKAWEVQEQMVDEYFTMAALLSSVSPPQQPSLPSARRQLATLKTAMDLLERLGKPLYLCAH